MAMVPLLAVWRGRVVSYTVMSVAFGCGGRIAADVGSSFAGGVQTNGGTSGAPTSGVGAAFAGGGRPGDSSATMAEGGQLAFGGSMATGGYVTTGGRMTTASMLVTGGKPTTGGAMAMGGFVTAGGTIATGGSRAVGGAAGSAGAPLTMGGSRAGGASSQGGTRASGVPTFGGAGGASSGTVTGGSMAPGGTTSTGGTSALGGSSPAVKGAGYYDLWIEQPLPVVEDCTPAFSEQRLNVNVGGDGRAEVYAYPDFHLVQCRDYDATWSEASVTFSTSSSCEDVQFSLELGASGFTGVGTAAIPYRCTSGTTTTRSVSVRLLPDTTPPKLRLTPLSHVNQDGVLAFVEFRPEFSEPVTFRDDVVNTYFPDVYEAADSVYVVDAVDTRVLDIEWIYGTAIGEGVLRFKDYRSLVNHQVLPGLNRVGLADPSGNLAVPVQEPWLLLPSLAIETGYDFDNPPDTGLLGNAHYEALGSALCESGGCIVLESQVSNLYHEREPPFPDAVLGVNLAFAEGTYYRTRFQLWANRTDVTLMERYPTGCSGYMTISTWSSNADAGDSFKYRSGWLDAKIWPCNSPERDRGIAFVMGCEDCDSTDPSSLARLAIERIELLDAY